MVKTQNSSEKMTVLEKPGYAESTAKDGTDDGTVSMRFVDLSEAELDELIGRVEQAMEHGLALSTRDYQLLLGAIMMLANLHERIEKNDLTIRKLKKLLGMVRSSEKLRDVLPDEADTADENTRGAPGKKQPKRKKPLRAKPVNPQIHRHALQGMSSGDPCPSCNLGKVYKYQPAVLVRVNGHAPLSTHRHLAEQLRCNACGEIFTAALPEDVLADGPRDQMYGYTSRSVMVINKYYAANPFYRQQTLNNLLGESITASSVFDQCEKVANALQPVFNVLNQRAANAELFYLDDTTNRIVDQKPQIKQSRDGRKRLRSGIYTSSVLAIDDQKRPVVLFRTSVGHAGEFMHEILNLRDASRAPPMLMSDALSANHVTDHAFVKCLCNAHGRRGFHELAYQHPDLIADVLKRYGKIWDNDDHCSDHGLSPQERLAYHRDHSEPHLQSIRAHCQTLLDSSEVEPNSNLGNAMQYFIRHYEGLSAFCRVPGAPLDNNIIERLIKIVVRNRRNSLFFKTLAGAAISDVLTSVLVTCQENGVDAFRYLNAIQKNQLSMKASPENWLPWNYPDKD